MSIELRSLHIRFPHIVSQTAGKVNSYTMIFGGVKAIKPL